MLRVSSLGVAVIAVAVSGPAAAANLVTNGGFEMTTTGYGLLGTETNVTGWTDAPVLSKGKPTKKLGQDYVYAAGTADTALPKVNPLMDPSHYDNGELWGPDDGAKNGMPDASPAGGNFISLSGGKDPSALTQTISALKPGQTYVLTFYYAFAQGYGARRSGSVDSISATLGSQTQVTSPITMPSEVFFGWQQAQFTFKDFSGSDVLSFLAAGTIGDPPYALLDGVSLTTSSIVPEPSAWAMMLLGVSSLGAIMRRRRAFLVSA